MEKRGRRRISFYDRQPVVASLNNNAPRHQFQFQRDRSFQSRFQITASGLRRPSSAGDDVQNVLRRK